MSTLNIAYNGTPLNYPATVSVANEYFDYGSRWGTVKKISIQGIIAPNCQSDMMSVYSSLVSAQNSILSAFNAPFGDLNVGSTIIKNCKLDSIDFQDSTFFGSVNFTVSLSAYDEALFTSSKVIDPIDSITYSEQRNNSIQIIRRVSARGINTTGNQSNALTNARSYVNSRLGFSTSLPKISKITNKDKYNLGTLKPRKIVETIDRINASISVEHTYIIKSGQTGDSNMFYTVDCQYDDEKGLNTGTIKGTVTGSIGQDMSSVRSDFKSFSPFSKLNGLFNDMGHGKLLDQPENVSVNENSREKTIEFSYTYNSIASVVKTFEKTFSMQTDYLTDKVTINFSGKVEFRGGQVKRQQAASSYSFKADDAASLCSQFYRDNSVAKFGTNAKIIPVPLTFEIKRDIVNGIVTINATCDNRPIPPDQSFTTFDYTLTANTSTHYFSTAYFLSGTTSGLKYNIKTRGEISVQGTATAKRAGLDQACISMADGVLGQADTAVGPLTDSLLVESKVDSADKPDDSGYTYGVTVTKTGLTSKMPTNYGASN
jgi:hypothetical protein